MPKVTLSHCEHIPHHGNCASCKPRAPIIEKGPEESPPMNHTKDDGLIKRLIKRAISSLFHSTLLCRPTQSFDLPQQLHRPQDAFLTPAVSASLSLLHPHQRPTPQPGHPPGRERPGRERPRQELHHQAPQKLPADFPIVAPEILPAKQHLQRDSGHRGHQQRQHPAKLHRNSLR